MYVSIIFCKESINGEVIFIIYLFIPLSWTWIMHHHLYFPLLNTLVLKQKCYAQVLEPGVRGILYFFLKLLFL